MDYQAIIDQILADYQHPCDKEIPVGMYRRVMWELYTQQYPQPMVEWKTEIIPIGTHLYTENPFGEVSMPLPVINGTTPPTEGGGSTEPPVGILVEKIGYYFTSQQEIDEYILSIGATKLNGNNWYGADLSKSNLFKNPDELLLYKIENSGGILTTQGARINPRTRMAFNEETQGFTSIDYYYQGNRVAFMWHKEDGSGCTYTGMQVRTDADTSIPGVPSVVPPVLSPLPPELGRAGVSATLSFPYNNIVQSMMSAYNTRRKTFKLSFTGLSGVPVYDCIHKMYDRLSASMEELIAGCIAAAQQAWQVAIMQFKQIISAAMSIVGGGWSMIKSFLPSISIAGISINILDLVFNNSAVQSLKTQFGNMNADDVIQGIYSAIGSSYDYSVEYVKCASRDIVDALTDLYDWCIAQFQNGCVAMCKLLGDLAQLWSMPPIVPNPLWAAIKAVNEIFMQIKPLDIIMGGNFPGFTAMDLYQAAQSKVKVVVDSTYAQIRSVEQQMKDVYATLKAKKHELSHLLIKQQQYLKGMWEQITEEATARYEAAVQEAKDLVSGIESNYAALQHQVQDLTKSISNLYDLGMQELRKLPLLSEINKFLGYCGASIDSLLTVFENEVAGVKSLYRDYMDSSRSFKDTCKVIYNQIQTLALSKITQWVNKLLHLIGLTLVFPSVGISLVLDEC